MKHSPVCGLLTTLLACGGCDAGRIDAPQAAHPARSADKRPFAAEAVDPAGQAADENRTDEAPRTPGAAVYGEVVAATDEIVEVLHGVDSTGTAPALRRAVQRFEVAGRNWKIYLANTSDAEVARLQQSPLAEHAADSEQKLRQNILRTARDSAGLLPELRHLVRVWQDAMSPTERAEFEQWIAENHLPL